MIQNDSNSPWVIVFLIIAISACLTFSVLGGAASSLQGGSFEGGFKKSATLGFSEGDPIWNAFTVQREGPWK